MMTTDHSTNVIQFKTPADKQFEEAYADMIMVVHEVIKKHDKLVDSDWLRMMSSMAGQLVFNASPDDHKAHFIQAVAGICSGISKHRDRTGRRKMEVVEFLEFVQLKK